MRLLPVVSIVAGIALESLVVGCGSSDCAETASCGQSSRDAAPSADQSVDGSGEGGVAIDDALDGTPMAAGDEGDAADDVIAESEGASDASVDAVGGESDAPATPGDTGVDAPADGAPGEASAGCSSIAPDCSNPQCSSGYMCTPPAPSGWFGPIALFDQGGGPPTPAPASCSGTYTNDNFDGNSGPSAQSASCSCSCGGPQGACTNPTITVYSDNQCGSSNNCGVGGPPSCTVADGTRCASGGQSEAVTALPQPTGTGSCDAGATTSSIPAWSNSWARTGRGCGPNRVFGTLGCPGGQVCADRPASTFAPTLCVWTMGNVDCSTTPGYSLLHHYYGGIADNRGCGVGTCSCGAPAGVSCTLTGATSYATSNCSDGGTALVTTLNHCNNPGVNTILGMTATVSATGSCTASGAAAPTGGVANDPSTAITVCCH